MTKRIIKNTLMLIVTAILLCVGYVTIDKGRETIHINSIINTKDDKKGNGSISDIGVNDDNDKISVDETIDNYVEADEEKSQESKDLSKDIEINKYYNNDNPSGMALWFENTIIMAIENEFDNVSNITVDVQNKSLNSHDGIETRKNENLADNSQDDNELGTSNEDDNVVLKKDDDLTDNYRKGDKSELPDNDGIKTNIFGDTADAKKYVGNENNKLEIKYYVLFVIESLCLAGIITYLILSKMNKKLFKEVFSNRNDIIVYSTIVMAMTLVFTIGCIFIVYMK